MFYNQGHHHLPPLLCASRQPTNQNSMMFLATRTQDRVRVARRASTHQDGRTPKRRGADPTTGTNSVCTVPRLRRRQGDRDSRTPGLAGHVWNLSPKGDDLSTGACLPGKKKHWHKSLVPKTPKCKSHQKHIGWRNS